MALILMNQSFLSQVLTYKYKILAKVLVFLVCSILLFYRIFGFSIQNDQIRNVCIQGAVWAFVTLIYIIFTNTVENLQTEKDEEAKGREQNLVSKSYYEMMQSLEEAIVVLKEGVVEFQNEIFESMINRIMDVQKQSQPYTSQQVLNFKFITQYESNNDDSFMQTSRSNISRNDSFQLKSLQQILNMHPQQLKDKVFVLNLQKLEMDHEGSKFAYVHIKIKNIKSSQSESSL